MVIVTGFGLIFFGAMIIVAIIGGAILITIAIHNIYHDDKEKIRKATKLLALIYSVIIGIIFIFPLIGIIRLALALKDGYKKHYTYIELISSFDYISLPIYIYLLLIVYAWGSVYLMRLIIIWRKSIAIKNKERGVNVEVTIDSKHNFAGNSGQYASRPAVHEKSDRSNYYYIAGGLALGIIVAFAYLYLR